MKEIIGCCGYNCHLCAACSDDPKLRQKIVFHHLLDKNEAAV